MFKRNSARNAVKYGSEFLYTSFNATGYHFNTNVAQDPNGELRNVPSTECSGNLIQQLHRIQAMDYGFSANYKDINEFGKMARVAAVASETPEVTVNFEYFLSDAYNEQALGFIVDGEHQALHNHISMEGRMGCNLFLTTMPEGHDVVNADLDNEAERITVIGVGNAFLNQYAVMVEVGSIPKARMSFDAFNIRSYKGISNLPLPSANPRDYCFNEDIRFSIPDTYQSFVYKKVKNRHEIVYHEAAGALSPGNVRLSLDDGGLFAKTSDELGVLHNGAAQIQGFTLNVPLGNTKLTRLGSYFEFGRAINFPSTMEVEVKAWVADLKGNTSTHELFKCPTQKFNLVLLLEDCRGILECDETLKPLHTNMAYYIKGATLDQESFESNISDNKVVTLKFSAPVASLDDVDHGLFIFGKSHFPDRPKILAFGQPL
jgi:hypothetical protein